RGSGARRLREAAPRGENPARKGAASRPASAPAALAARDRSRLRRSLPRADARRGDARLPRRVRARARRPLVSRGRRLPRGACMSETWRTLWDYTAPRTARHACRAHREGIARLGYTAERMPTVEELETRVHSETGWRLVR